MQRYLNQLLGDLEQATLLAPGHGSYVFKTSYQDDENAGAQTLAARFVKLHELFGLNTGVFPPVERLNKRQVTALLKALERLWQAWSVDLECPSSLGARKRYQLMVSWMEQEMMPYHPDHGTAVDFCCKRDLGLCPFGEEGRCECRDLEEAQRRFYEQFDLDEEEEPYTPSPVDELYAWLRAKPETDYEIWDDFGEEERAKFIEDEEVIAWLYFYRPDHHAELQGEESDPEDFEDFEWESDFDNESEDMPF